jgi:hypothetical protein
VPLGSRERGQAPVVEHEERGLGELGEEPGVGAIPAGDGEVVQQARDAHAIGGVVGGRVAFARMPPTVPATRKTYSGRVARNQCWTAA